MRASWLVLAIELLRVFLRVLKLALPTLVLGLDLLYNRFIHRLWVYFDHSRFQTMVQVIDLHLLFFYLLLEHSEQLEVSLSHFDIKLSTTNLL
jgi:hypothetical protein